MGIFENPKGGGAYGKFVAGGLEVVRDLVALSQSRFDLGVLDRQSRLAFGDSSGKGRRFKGSRTDRRHVGMLRRADRQDAPLQLPPLHGELSAQVILLRSDLDAGEGEQRRHPLPGKPGRPRIHCRQDEERAQARQEEAEREDHDGFDHAVTLIVPVLEDAPGKREPAFGKGDANTAPRIVGPRRARAPAHMRVPFRRPAGIHPQTPSTASMQDPGRSKDRSARPSSDQKGFQVGSLVNFR